MKYLILLSTLFCSYSAFAGDFFEKNGLALGGYDPVSYFQENGPKLGNPLVLVKIQGSDFAFVSEQTKKEFLKNPEKYLPQFNGFCAYGLSRGYKAKTDPDAYSIVKGKLYLNYDLSVREKWNSDRTAYIKKANENWPTIKSATKIYQ